MFRILKLVLPAIIPSWRFFDVIAASPRIQYSLLIKQDDSDLAWQEFRPRPNNIAFITMIRRLFWNAKWNETLYLVSCAERLVANPTKHSVDQFFNRLTANLTHEEKTGIVKYIQFRLVFIGRQGSDLVEQIYYESPVKLIEQLDSL